MKVGIAIKLSTHLMTGSSGSLLLTYYVTAKKLTSYTLQLISLNVATKTYCTRYNITSLSTMARQSSFRTAQSSFNEFFLQNTSTFREDKWQTEMIKFCTVNTSKSFFYQNIAISLTIHDPLNIPDKIVFDIALFQQQRNSCVQTHIPH